MSGKSIKAYAWSDSGQITAMRNVGSFSEKRNESIEYLYTASDASISLGIQRRIGLSARNECGKADT